jgi:glycosyltransferase involved in cell wall biosynthesis
MIHGRDLLVFAPGPWDDIWRNRHQLLTILARENTVLWVERRVFLSEALRRAREGHLSWQRFACPRVERVRSRLYVYRDLILPRSANRWPLGGLIRRMRERSIRRVLRRLGMDRPILWLFWPGQQDAIGRYGEELVIYHVVDEYSGYGGMSDEYRESLRQQEEQLLRRADLVFVTSPALYESKGGYNPRTFLIPNAVDYAAFEAVVEGSVAPPAIMAGVPRPVVGYVGAINAKIDLSLVLRLAERRSDWSFLMVGPVSSEESEDRAAYAGLRSLPNVLFTGRVDVSEVPNYINACDVCLMPYKRNIWTQHVNSLKLFEYLACGKPIVGTDIPACREAEEHLRIGRDAAEFEHHVEEALRENDPELVGSRRSLAARNTWEQRVELLSQAIESTMAELAGGREWAQVGQEGETGRSLHGSR